MDKLEVGDIVGYEGEIGIVISLEPSTFRLHRLAAQIKWMDNDGDITQECAYNPVGIYIIARASGS